jgi:hypothetical protein
MIQVRGIEHPDQVEKRLDLLQPEEVAVGANLRHRDRPQAETDLPRRREPVECDQMLGVVVPQIRRREFVRVGLDVLLDRRLVVTPGAQIAPEVLVCGTVALALGKLPAQGRYKFPAAASVLASWYKARSALKTAI